MAQRLNYFEIKQPDTRKKPLMSEAFTKSYEDLRVVIKTAITRDDILKAVRLFMKVFANEVDEDE